MKGPFGDPDWEIWACSPPNYDFPRVDAWFEMHNLDRKFIARNQPWIDVIVRHPRVYLARPDSRVPHGIIYPLDEMRKKFGSWFWTSSLAYMMALAIDKEPEAIGLWGVDMSAAEEYGYQRAGCHYFIREAERAGIKIVAAGESDILNPPPMYGYKEFSPMYVKQKARRKELEERLNDAVNRKKMAEREENIFRGALDDMTYVDNTYCPTRFRPPGSDV